jgi:hypothetical protein
MAVKAQAQVEITSVKDIKDAAEAAQDTADEAKRLVAEKANITDLDAANANIKSLQTAKADVADLTAAQADISNLKTDKLDADTASATYATITDLTAANADIASLKTDKLDADTASATYATIKNLDATNANVSTLQTDLATANTLIAKKLDTETANATYATIANLNSATADISSLKTGKADIDAANITEATTRTAWIDKLMVQSQLLAYDGSIYTLDAVEVNANNITAGTLDVNRIIITDDSGEKYLVDFSSGSAVQTKLDGNVVEDRTIAADKIIANSIGVDEITANNLQGTGGWINLHTGTFKYANATSGNYIKWDGEKLSLATDAMYIDSRQGVILGDKAGANIRLETDGVGIYMGDVLMAYIKNKTVRSDYVHTKNLDVSDWDCSQMDDGSLILSYGG